MSRVQIDPLRTLRPQERSHLERVSRAFGLPAALVARAKALLAVANGHSYVEAAHLAGRRTGDAVAALVSVFNRQGLAALEPRHAGGPAIVYDAAAKERILREFRRKPDRERDGTATWSLTTLQRALRRAPDGLPFVSTYTIWFVLREAGLSWQRDRSWCKTGVAIRKRKSGEVEVHDPDTEPKKVLIEQAYTEGPRLGLAVWGMDEAGPYQAIPQPGICWQPLTCPVRYPHEHVRHGTAKNAHPVSSSHGHGARQGRAELPERRVARLAQAAALDDPGQPATGTRAAGGRQPRQLGTVASRTHDQADAECRPASTAAAADHGQPGRSQDARFC